MRAAWLWSVAAVLVLAPAAPAQTAGADRRDAEIRARLQRGDEDSVVNLLLYGVSFTTAPRLTEADVAHGFDGTRDVLRRRIDDLLRAAGGPGRDERLAFVHGVLGPRPGRRRLEALVDRYVTDVRHFAEASEKHVGLSTLFRERGLSSDTSIYPGFAVEQALRALRDAEAIAPVLRVAVIGPGLDFTDKREGLDVFPLQSIQPFALIDSLLRLGLSDAAIRLTAFDLNPRVIGHLQRAQADARLGKGYHLELPRNTAVAWNSELVAYWERFGDRIGEPAAPTPLPPSAGAVTSRAVGVRPDIVTAVTPRDLNVVVRDEPAFGGAFDLIVATNTLIYYDRHEQELALANIARMLRSGGWFFANDAPPPPASVPLTTVGWTDLTYSDQVNSHDRLTWYRRP